MKRQEAHETEARVAEAGESAPPENFVRLSDVAPQIAQDMRYAESENFLGRPVPGYRSGACWLRREAALALEGVARDAAAQGLSLVVYDGYRPQRATRAFLAWAQDPRDVARKADYYPRLDKADLFELGYIARQSSHSTGAAVDLALVGLDFGSPFDLFDEISAADYPHLPEAARRNRALLRALMEARGFAPLAQEWWHFSLRALDCAPAHDFEAP